MKKSILISSPAAGLKDRLARYDDARHLDVTVHSSGAEIIAENFDYLILEPSKPNESLSLAQKFAKAGNYIIEVRRDNPFQSGIDPIRIKGAQIGLIAGLGDKGFEMALKAIAMKVRAK